jgi:glycosyltransferase involved in cell wall biosynthesis
MTEHIDITVVMSTYNRCEILPAAIESVLSQAASEVSYEFVVVDNNSTDSTRQIVESFISQGHHRLRYLFEPRQGLSHARNAGIATAEGEIVVFIDDDVRARSDWLRNIKRAFVLYADVECVGGKILPNWKTDPPKWLNSDHWGPLALQDHGDAPLCVNEKTPLCLAGANFSFRRGVFRDALFSPDFRRAQDMEFLVRFWRAGGQAMYVPDVVVVADVQDERLTKRYHRQWHATNGRFNSLMRLGELVGSDGQIMEKLPSTVKLFDAPGFMYRELISESAQWLVATARRYESLSFKHENRVRYLIGYISKRYEHEFTSRKRSHVVEVGRFIKAILHKKILSSLRS